MKKNLLNEKTALVFVIVLAAIVLSMPLLFRAIHKESSLPGKEPYYHSRVVEAISNDEGPGKDPLLVDERRPLLISPYHYMVSYLSRGIDEAYVVRFLPILLGILSAVLFFLMLRKHGVSYDLSLISVIVLISSPNFIYAYTLSTPLCLILFINLLAFFLLSSKSKYLSAVSILLFLTIPFFGVLDTVITLVLILIYAVLFKEKRLYAFVIIPACALLLTFVPQSGLFSAVNNPLINHNFFGRVVLELGSEYGFGFFVLLLAIIGFLTSLKLSKKYLLFNILFAGLIVFSIFFNHAFFYLNFAMALLVAFAFDKFLKMKWQISIIRDMTLFVVILGVLFSTVSFISRSAVSGPDENVIVSLAYLEQKQGNVLSHYSYGFWIESFAQKPVLMDSLFKGYDYKKRAFDSNSIYYSRNLENTKNILNKYEIRYIWIHKDMKNGLVWENENQGLLFLLKNSVDFQKVYNNTEVEIWEYESK